MRRSPGSPRILKPSPSPQRAIAFLQLGGVFGILFDHPFVPRLRRREGHSTPEGADVLPGGRVFSLPGERRKWESALPRAAHGDISIGMLKGEHFARPAEPALISSQIRRMSLASVIRILSRNREMAFPPSPWTASRSTAAGLNNRNGCHRAPSQGCRRRIADLILGTAEGVPVPEEREELETRGQGRCPPRPLSLVAARDTPVMPW